MREYLNGVPVSAKLQARVQRAIRELNYHPNHVASSLKARRTQTLGMVISDITNPFSRGWCEEPKDAALKHGYVITIINSTVNPRHFHFCAAGESMALWL